MEKMRKILLATDFSECGKHAQRYAFALAKRSSAELHIAHAVDVSYSSYAGVYGFGAPVDQLIQELKAHAQGRLDEVVDEARAANTDAHSHLLEGRPPEEITELARCLECNLIVAATHGRSGVDHFLFGSTCERIVRYATTPVLTVKSPEKEFVHPDGDIEIRRVLCPCDLSETCEEALPLAAGICSVFDAELILMHVIDNRTEYPMLLPTEKPPTPAEISDRAAKRLDELTLSFPDIRSRMEIVSGVPHAEIIESVGRNNIDLLVMTTHGRHGIQRALMGSTAEKIVRTAPVPILTLRPEQRVGSTENADRAAENPQPATSRASTEAIGEGFE